MKSMPLVTVCAFAITVSILTQAYLRKREPTASWPVNVQEIPPSCLVEADASADEIAEQFRQVIQQFELAEPAIPLDSRPMIYPTVEAWQSLSQRQHARSQLSILVESSDQSYVPSTGSEHRTLPLETREPRLRLMDEPYCEFHND